jgi:hypothetical protein
MAVIKSGASSDNLTIDPTSKAARVTLYDAAGRAITFQSKPTFFAANTFTPPATPTDMVTIYGSASKTIRVVSFIIGTTNTAAGSQQFFLIRRSSTNTAGTFVAGTAIQADTTDAAPTATVGHYTANPSSLGTTVGNINIKRVASPAAVPASFAGIAQEAGVDMLSNMANSMLDKPVTLAGTAQGLCLNFNSAALVAGQTHYYQVVWMEE